MPAIDFFDSNHSALVALAAAGLHATRLALWAPWKTRGRPILWILHLSYAWIVVHLVLRGLAAFDLAPAALATHALTVGAIGGLTLGMMTRTARGHTARPLTAGRAEVSALCSAAACRGSPGIPSPAAALGLYGRGDALRRTLVRGLHCLRCRLLPDPVAQAA